MNWNTLRILPLFVLVGACGGATPPADSPENADESSSSSKSKDDTSGGEDSQLGGSSLRSHKEDPTVPVTVKDDDTGKKKKDASCAGTNIPDLIAVASQDSCEVNDPQAEVNRRDVKDSLEVKVTADSPKVAPGGTLKLTVSLHNKGKAPVQLDFKVDPEPRVSFELSAPKGPRVDKPAGPEPALPPEVQSAPVPDAKISRVLLAPGGNATMALSWDAVKYKWASKEKAKGAVPGHGYPREPAGPIGKGKYVLRVVLPLVGLAEGNEHEYSQPKVDVEVAQ